MGEESEVLSCHSFPLWPWSCHLTSLCLLSWLKISCGRAGILLFSHPKYLKEGAYARLVAVFWKGDNSGSSSLELMLLCAFILCLGLPLRRGSLCFGVRMTHCFMPRCPKCSTRSPGKDIRVLCCLALLGVQLWFMEQFLTSCPFVLL